ncbi:unnamed protein product [Oikopleura dioica]|uniref:Uncharacterized protein n=1 Tax=Oikopleura dioica TaxID=34765 RepID=E4YDF3_OIKDI|nr:unnamed protein product [Oikopleura dioica]
MRWSSHRCGRSWRFQEFVVRCDGSSLRLRARDRAARSVTAAASGVFEEQMQDNIQAVVRSRQIQEMAG